MTTANFNILIPPKIMKAKLIIILLRDSSPNYSKLSGSVIQRKNFRDGKSAVINAEVV